MRGVIGPPLLVPGPAGPWRMMRARLAKPGVAVVYGRLDDWIPRLPLNRLRAILGRDWARYQSYSQARLRERFAASRLLLRHAAAAAIDTAAEQVDLAYQPGGRPYVRGCDQIEVSLSHTEELMVVGISRRGRIGVDVELGDRTMAGTGSESQTCTPYEQAVLDAMDVERRNSELVRLWTLKEAYSKARGQGLRFRFTEFGFALGEAGVRLVQRDGTPVGDKEWGFRTCVVDERYVVSVALWDTGFGEASDISAQTTLDNGLLDTLLGAAVPAVTESSPLPPRS